MPAGLLTIELLISGLVLWLGLYLISRDIKNLRLCLAGVGLVCYALCVNCAILHNYTSALAHIFNVARTGLLVFSLLVLLSVGIMLYFSSEDTTHRSTKDTKKIITVLLLTLFLFVPGTGLQLLPFSGSLQSGILFLAGLDLFALGLALAALDAINRGEALLPDILRSLDYSCGIAFLFGGQVLLVSILGTGMTLPMLILLMSTVATAIATQVFSDQVVTVLDKIAFSHLPWLQKARADLRTTASTLPRIKQDADPTELDVSEFTRLTRRALSNFGDLSRLASNPLTHLPIIETRLAAHGRKNDVLERANELKAVLTESIQRLKPRGSDEFGTSDEWRYYNALYFPYVVGLKPYSRRTQHLPTDPVARKALEWFRTQVPERTLYNWQTAATKLIVQDLRSKKD